MIPIVMSAFGTTTDAMATYAFIDGMIKKKYPDDDIIWAYSSRKITSEMPRNGKASAIHLEEALRQISARGISQVVVQSLHLFPGAEFHRLHATIRQSGLDCAVGSPLFTSPLDYHRLGRILMPTIDARPGQAILVLGHGTNHPVWTAYYSLEKILRRRFGDRLFVGVVEKYPDSNHLADEIADAGHTEVCIVPLFLVTGMHYRRDIAGDGPASWLNRLKSRGLAVNCLDRGLGLLPGVAELIIDHIALARDTLLPTG
jgi:sirohydrochlorin cobaltochelatase